MLRDEIHSHIDLSSSMVSIKNIIQKERPITSYRDLKKNNDTQTNSPTKYLLPREKISENEEVNVREKLAKQTKNAERILRANSGLGIKKLSFKFRSCNIGSQ